MDSFGILVLVIFGNFCVNSTTTAQSATAGDGTQTALPTENTTPPQSNVTQANTISTSTTKNATTAPVEITTIEPSTTRVAYTSTPTTTPITTESTTQITTEPTTQITTQSTTQITTEPTTQITTQSTTQITTRPSSTSEATRGSTNASFTTTPPISVDELLQVSTTNLSLEESEQLLVDMHTALDGETGVEDASQLVLVVELYATLGSTDQLENATLEESTSYIQSSLAVANSLLSDRYTSFYQDTNSSSEQTISPVSRLMNTTENLMISLADKIVAEGGESVNFTNDNLATEVKMWDSSGDPEPLVIPKADYFSEGLPTKAVMPEELFEMNPKLGVVSILYRNLANTIGSSAQENVEEQFASATTDSPESVNISKEIAILSKVLSISVVPPSAGVSIFKNHPVNMTFETDVQQVTENRSGYVVVDTNAAACVYWDIKNGSWSSIGCSFIEGDGSYSMCECEHLTSFAVLMQVREIEVSKPNQRALEIISYVGCSLSIAGVILLVATFVFLNIHTERVLVHINLAIAIGLARLMFLLVDAPPTNSDGCIAVAMAIYYTNMASFFWMLIEGVHLYLQVVVVFNIERSKLKFYMPIAWGIPIILMAVTCGVFASNIRKSDLCWLQISDNSIWMFVAPMLVIIAANTYILIRVVWVIFKLSAVNATSDLARTKQAAKATLMLQPVLGVTWIFGVLSLSSALIVFQYLFTIFNSLQGVLLFLFYCVFNSEVQETFSRFKKNWAMFNRTTKSSSVGPLMDPNCSTSYRQQSRGTSGTSVESSDLPLQNVPTFN